MSVCECVRALQWGEGTLWSIEQVWWPVSRYELPPEHGPGRRYWRRLTTAANGRPRDSPVADRGRAGELGWMRAAQA